ncbi:MAG: hypothetical protein K1X92_16805 [Bacteroidia bacterium]|nr:hypothetical protein [Bacteroidia bacterium]
MKKLFYILALTGVLGMSSCSKEQTQVQFELKGKEFVLEQPTPGSNTAQLEVPFEEIKAAVEAKGGDASQISDVKLEKVEIVAKDGNFDGFESILLQMTTPKANLSEVAVLNPVAKGTSAAQLKTAENAEMKKYFTGENLTVVLDMNSAEGDTLKHVLLLNAVFNLSSAKK